MQLRPVRAVQSRLLGSRGCAALPQRVQVLLKSALWPARSDLSRFDSTDAPSELPDRASTDLITQLFGGASLAGPR